MRRLACQPKLVRPACERRLVAREGFEPSKPLGRQIYSLLRLTASLPRQSLSSCPISRATASIPSAPSNLLIPGHLAPFVWSWRRDLNPRPADYKSAALPG